MSIWFMIIGFVMWVIMMIIHEWVFAIGYFALAVLSSLIWEFTQAMKEK